MPTLARKVLSSIFTDPDHDEKRQNDRRSRGIGSLIRKSSRNGLTQRESARQSLPARDDNSTVRAGTLCKNKIGEESCWSVVADPLWQDTVYARFTELLDAQTYKLYARDRREFDPWMELFLVGKTIDEARLALIISCNSEADLERLQKLLKKIRTVPGHDMVTLLTMLGGPRSMVPLIPLVAPSSPEPHPLTADKKLQAGTPVYGVVGPQDSITIPAEIWIGPSLPDAHKAVIGGLISLQGRDGKLGLTVAHTPLTLDRPQAHTETRTRSVIGKIQSGTVDRRRNYLDWALVEFNSGIRLQTTYEPPVSVVKGQDAEVAVKVLAPRGAIRGTLSPSITNISIRNRQSYSRTQAIILDEPIEPGDCGIWVVGLDGTLYGHIAYGHAGDRVAYLLSASDVFGDIEDMNSYCGGKVSLAGLAENSQRQILGAAAERKEQRREAKDRERNEQQYSRDNKVVTKTDAQSRNKSKRLRLHQKWRSKFRRDDRHTVLRFAGTCIAYMLFLTYVMIAYFIASAWAIGSNSKIAARARKHQATLMFTTIEEFREQVTKQMVKYHPHVLEAPAEGMSDHVRRKLDLPKPPARRVKADATPQNSNAGHIGSSTDKVLNEGYGLKDTGPSSGPTPGTDGFWSRLFKRFSIEKSLSSHTADPAASNKSDSKILRDRPASHPVYKYSGDEGTDDDDSSSDTNVVNILSRAFMDGYLSKKKSDPDRSSRRARDNYSDSDSSYQVRRRRRDRNTAREEIIIRRDENASANAPVVTRHYDDDYRYYDDGYDNRDRGYYDRRREIPTRVRSRARSPPYIQYGDTYITGTDHPPESLPASQPQQSSTNPATSQPHDPYRSEVVEVVEAPYSGPPSPEPVSDDRAAFTGVETIPEASGPTTADEMV